MTRVQRPATSIRADLRQLPGERAWMRRKETVLLQEAKAHPEITMAEAAELAGVKRTNAYKIANREEN